MPTPMPTMAAVYGAHSGTSTNAAQHLAERHRDAEAEQRREQRQAHRDHRAEGDEQDDGRRDQADALGARGHRLGLGRDRAADLDLQRLVTGREDGLRPAPRPRRP